MPTFIATLRLDAAFNLAGGAGLLAAAGWLAPHVGITVAWPLRLLAVALLVHGVENLVVSRRRNPGGLAALAAVDLGFATGVLALATVNPTGATGWVRWTLAAVGAASIGMALIKLAGRHQPAPPPGREAASASVTRRGIPGGRAHAFPGGVVPRPLAPERQILPDPEIRGLIPTEEDVAPGHVDELLPEGFIWAPVVAGQFGHGSPTRRRDPAERKRPQCYGWWWWWWW